MKKSQVVEKAYKKAEKREITLGYPQGKHTVNMLFWGMLQMIENSTLNSKAAAKELDDIGELFENAHLEPSTIGWNLMNLLKNQKITDWSKEDSQYNTLQNRLEGKSGTVDALTVINEILAAPTEEIRSVLGNSTLLQNDRKAEGGKRDTKIVEKSSGASIKFDGYLSSVQHFDFYNCHS